MQYKQALISAACSFEHSSNAFEVPEPDLAQDLGTSMPCPTQHRIPNLFDRAQDFGEAPPSWRTASAVQLMGETKPNHTRPAAFCSCHDIAAEIHRP